MSTRAAPASVGQRLLWLMDRRRGGGGALNERLAWRIGGPLDVGAVRHALDALVVRHEALRTTFSGAGRSLVQEIGEPRAAPLEVARLAESTDTGVLGEIVAQEAEAGIDPGECPWRARLWRIGDRDHVLLIVLHHLVTDSGSNAILARDFASLYAGTRSTRAQPEPPPVAWQYADWSEWQRGLLEDGGLARLQGFWRAALAGARFVELPRRAAATAGDEKGYERRRLDAEVADRLRQTARAQQTTPFAVALAAFYVALHDVTGQRDLTIASLFANRTRPEVAHTVGFFVNMIALRGRIDGDASFAEVLRDTQANVAAAAEHQQLPLQMLPPDSVRAASEHGGARAEDVVFQFVDGEPRASAQAQVEGLELTPIERQGRRSRFALELFVAHMAHAVAAVLVYDSSSFDSAWAAGFADRYARLLETVAARPHAPVEELLAGLAA